MSICSSSSSAPDLLVRVLQDGGNDCTMRSLALVSDDKISEEGERGGAAAAHSPPTVYLQHYVLLEEGPLSIRLESNVNKPLIAKLCVDGVMARSNFRILPQGTHTIRDTKASQGERAVPLRFDVGDLHMKAIRENVGAIVGDEETLAPPQDLLARNKTIRGSVEPYCGLFEIAFFEVKGNNDDNEGERAVSVSDRHRQSKERGDVVPTEKWEIIDKNTPLTVVSLWYGYKDQLIAAFPSVFGGDGDADELASLINESESDDDYARKEKETSKLFAPSPFPPLCGKCGGSCDVPDVPIEADRRRDKEGKGSSKDLRKEDNEPKPFPFKSSTADNVGAGSNPKEKKIQLKEMENPPKQEIHKRSRRASVSYTFANTQELKAAAKKELEAGWVRLHHLRGVLGKKGVDTNKAVGCNSQQKRGGIGVRSLPVSSLTFGGGKKAPLTTENGSSKKKDRLEYLLGNVNDVKTTFHTLFPLMAKKGPFLEEEKQKRREKQRRLSEALEAERGFRCVACRSLRSCSVGSSQSKGAVSPRQQLSSTSFSALKGSGSGYLGAGRCKSSKSPTVHPKSIEVFPQMRGVAIAAPIPLPPPQRTAKGRRHSPSATTSTRDTRNNLHNEGEEGKENAALMPIRRRVSSSEASNIGGVGARGGRGSSFRDDVVTYKKQLWPLPVNEQGLTREGTEKSALEAAKVSLASLSLTRKEINSNRARTGGERNSTSKHTTKRRARDGSGSGRRRSPWRGDFANDKQLERQQPHRDEDHVVSSATSSSCATSSSRQRTSPSASPSPSPSFDIDYDKATESNSANVNTTWQAQARTAVATVESRKQKRDEGAQHEATAVFVDPLHFAGGNEGGKSVRKLSINIGEEYMYAEHQQVEEEEVAEENMPNSQRYYPPTSGHEQGALSQPTTTAALIISNDAIAHQQQHHLRSLLPSGKGASFASPATAASAVATAMAFRVAQLESRLAVAVAEAEAKRSEALGWRRRYERMRTRAKHYKQYCRLQTQKEQHQRGEIEGEDANLKKIPSINGEDDNKVDDGCSTVSDTFSSSENEEQAAAVSSEEKVGFSPYRNRLQSITHHTGRGTRQQHRQRQHSLPLSLSSPQAPRPGSVGPTRASSSSSASSSSPSLQQAKTPSLTTTWPRQLRSRSEELARAVLVTSVGTSNIGPSSCEAHGQKRGSATDVAVMTNALTPHLSQETAARVTDGGLHVRNKEEEGALSSHGTHSSPQYSGFVASISREVSPSSPPMPNNGSYSYVHASSPQEEAEGGKDKVRQQSVQAARAPQPNDKPSSPLSSEKEGGPNAGRGANMDAQRDPNLNREASAVDQKQLLSSEESSSSSSAFASPVAMRVSMAVSSSTAGPPTPFSGGSSACVPPNHAPSPASHRVAKGQGQPLYSYTPVCTPAAKLRQQRHGLDEKKAEEKDQQPQQCLNSQHEVTSSKQSSTHVLQAGAQSSISQSSIRTPSNGRPTDPDRGRGLVPAMVSPPQLYSMTTETGSQQHQRSNQRHRNHDEVLLAGGGGTEEKEGSPLHVLHRTAGKAPAANSSPSSFPSHFSLPQGGNPRGHSEPFRSPSPFEVVHNYRDDQQHQRRPIGGGGTQLHLDVDGYASADGDILLAAARRIVAEEELRRIRASEEREADKRHSQQKGSNTKPVIATGAARREVPVSQAAWSHAAALTERQQREKDHHNTLDHDHHHDTHRQIIHEGQHRQDSFRGQSYASSAAGATVAGPSRSQTRLLYENDVMIMPAHDYRYEAPSLPAGAVSPCPPPKRRVALPQSSSSVTSSQRRPPTPQTSSFFLLLDTTDGWVPPACHLSEPSSFVSSMEGGDDWP